MNSEIVLEFWFKELSESDWFKKDDRLDKLISDRFLSLHKKACAGELSHWRESIEGRLAEIIVLDQFSRNIFRDKPEAFLQDSMALVLSQEAIKQPSLSSLTPKYLAFLYMPFMHSESLKMHEIAVTLFSKPGLENNLSFELKHKKIIDRFGRYPHRNKILGRVSTAEEVEFLKTDGSSF